MTFTDAEQEKAVELYKTYKDAEWWPERLRWNPAEMGGPAYWTRSGEYIERQTAIAVIAWAMVAHLYANGGCDVAPEDYFGKGPVCFAYDKHALGLPHYGATTFLALAAAVEALDKGG